MLAYVHSPDNNKESLAIVKRFDFESKLQRMSAIVKHVSQEDEDAKLYTCFVKGSPEMI